MAAADKETVSAVDSTVLSSRAVIVKENVLDDTDRAGMDNVNRLFVNPETVKSAAAPNVAVPPATVTVTSVAVDKSDVAPPNRADTVTGLAPAPSTTNPGSTDNVKSSSSSSTVKSNVPTEYPVKLNLTLPDNLIISGPSVTVSSMATI